MPTVFRFQYRFHPAGQGIFASGTVAEVNPPSPPFHWVFDCGSVSKSETLIPAVRRYKDLIVGDALDLLCISHFDADHVNGLGELLTGLHVGTVVLPYCSPLERLIVGARKSSRDDDYYQFLGNPVGYLLERAASIQRIIIVGGPDDQPPLGLPDRPPNLGENPSERPRREGWILKPLEHPAEAAEPICDAATLKAAAAAQTEVWHKPSSFAALAFLSTHTAYWEFLFYHKPIDPAAIVAIRRRVADVLRSIRRSIPDMDVTEILGNEIHRKRIKNAYVTALNDFGQPEEDINFTSLCVYSGPQLDHLAGSEISPPWPHPLIGAPQVPWFGPHGYPDICSVLYTGDTNLKPTANRQDLRRFLTRPRWDKVCVLQVPHHGSRENWEIGSAHEFRHFYSVFCADENHRKYKHPSREVLLDLLHRGPLLANKVLGWYWQGAAYFR